jgi:hypothetical protein
VADLEHGVEDLSDTLAEHAERAWRDRFGDDIAAFERDLDGLEPPVDWEQVQETLEARRERTFENR